MRPRACQRVKRARERGLPAGAPQFLERRDALAREIGAPRIVADAGIARVAERDPRVAVFEPRALGVADAVRVDRPERSERVLRLTGAGGFQRLRIRRVERRVGAAEVVGVVRGQLVLLECCQCVEEAVVELRPLGNDECGAARAALVDLGVRALLEERLLRGLQRPETRVSARR
jgi:hypothetical protein